MNQVIPSEHQGRIVSGQQTDDEPPDGEGRLVAEEAAATEASPNVGGDVEGANTGTVLAGTRRTSMEETNPSTLAFLETSKPTGRHGASNASRNREQATSRGAAESSTALISTGGRAVLVDTVAQSRCPVDQSDVNPAHPEIGMQADESKQENSPTESNNSLEGSPTPTIHRLRLRASTFSESVFTPPISQRLQISINAISPSRKVNVYLSFENQQVRVQFHRKQEIGEEAPRASFTVSQHSRLFSRIKIDLWERNGLGQVRTGKARIRISDIPMVTGYFARKRVRVYGSSNSSAPSSRANSDSEEPVSEASTDYETCDEMERPDSSEELSLRSELPSPRPRKKCPRHQVTGYIVVTLLYLDDEAGSSRSLGLRTGPTTFSGVAGSVVTSPRASSPVATSPAASAILAMTLFPTDKVRRRLEFLQDLARIKNSFLGAGWSTSVRTFRPSMALLGDLLRKRPLFPPPEHPMADEKKLRELLHYYKYSMASYGWAGLTYAGKGTGLVDSLKSSKTVILEYLSKNNHPDHMLACEMTSGDVYRPLFFVLYDSNEIIITIRGTMNLSDLLTDLMCEYVDFRGGFVHQGMVRSAATLFSRLIPELPHWIRRWNPQRIVILGHSLGAGVATVLTLLLYESLHEWGKLVSLPGGKILTVDLHTYAYAPPPSMSLEVLKQFGTNDRIVTPEGTPGSAMLGSLDALIDAVVFGEDYIPRLCFGNMMDFKDMLNVAGKLVETDTSTGGKINRGNVGRRNAAQTGGGPSTMKIMDVMPFKDIKFRTLVASLDPTHILRTITNQYQGREIGGEARAPEQPDTNVFRTRRHRRASISSPKDLHDGAPQAMKRISSWQQVGPTQWMPLFPNEMSTAGRESGKPSGGTISSKAAAEPGKKRNGPRTPFRFPSLPSVFKRPPSQRGPPVRPLSTSFSSGSIYESAMTSLDYPGTGTSHRSFSSDCSGHNGDQTGLTSEGGGASMNALSAGSLCGSLSSQAPELLRHTEPRRFSHSWSDRSRPTRNSVPPNIVTSGAKRPASPRFIKTKTLSSGSLPITDISLAFNNSTPGRSMAKPADLFERCEAHHDGSKQGDRIAYLEAAWTKLYTSQKNCKLSIHGTITHFVRSKETNQPARQKDITAVRSYKEFYSHCIANPSKSYRLWYDHFPHSYEKALVRAARRASDASET